jgi:hypothetical protein
MVNPESANKEPSRFMRHYNPITQNKRPFLAGIKERTIGVDLKTLDRPVPT